MPETESMDWVFSGGGPLLLAPDAALLLWGGSDSSAINDAGTDYQRACQLKAEIASISIGEETGLVIGGQPFETCWLPHEADGGGTLVRWDFGPAELDIGQLVASESALLSWKRNLTFAHDGLPLRLFDSAFPGSDIRTPSVGIKLRAGLYEVESTQIQKGDEVSIRLHRFRRVA
jgi:hypothetical protein